MLEGTAFLVAAFLIETLPVSAAAGESFTACPAKDGEERAIEEAAIVFVRNHRFVALLICSDVKSTPFQPYSEVFGLQRFRECELIHGRWAMLATLGALTVEWLTGITWQDAGKVELVEGSSYLGQPLPFSISTLIWIEVLVVGYIEFQRNAELDPEKRLYPGGSYFDPLGLAADPEKKEVLQLAEIKHARLAMVAFLGFAVQAAATGKGPLNNWATHLSDPLHTTIFDTFGFFS
ncbi:hypothetical protein D3Z37_19510 [Lachnospiraceae bacterium]|nr:hypothetical protein [Lachnospiraceae bacterium]